ncbi:alpha/beta hydrolase family protein [Bacillus alkalicellulosilyticus]|uniref:alpha/beta hydrolase family protein n=1 Tax=Alkalihalobacterium alkalicellulosilyticum TaxID=1912214 RepID=UPI0009965FB4|nr:prolyl oligopeptidase family serine peptidase [Bacillus alkalicellulosilyticus]
MDGEIIDQVELPSSDPKLKLQIVTYVSQGLKVKGYLVEPMQAGKLPGLLYLRGGLKNVGMVRIERIMQYAAEGFIVFAPFYRGNKGGEGREDFAGEDRYDAVYSVDVLLAQPKISGQIHVLGFSRGGVMALFTAILRPEVATVTCWNGVSDMLLTYEERVDLRRMMKRVVGGSVTKYPERYVSRTPLSEVKKLTAPVCIIHGIEDEHVSFKHALRLEQALHKASKEYERWYYPTFTHHFPEPFNSLIVKKVTVWMKKQ